MGFNFGAPFKVVKNDVGPVIVSLSGNKVALGRGLAQKIMVENMEEHDGGKQGYSAGRQSQLR